MKNMPFDFTFQHGKFTHDHRIENQSFIYFVDNSICFTEKESVDPSFVKNELSDNIINHQYIPIDSEYSMLVNDMRIVKK
jgi:hypothetical protein